jgi:choline-sulfatase
MDTTSADGRGGKSVTVDAGMGRDDLRAAREARSIRVLWGPSNREIGPSPAPFGRTDASLARRSWLHRAVLGALLAIAPLACAPGEKDVPDRVVLVTIDTLRADRVGCYGDADARTPFLDTLAARGVRFETAVSPAPLTLPSHASLMTAVDPPIHGVRHNAVHRLDAALPTLAERMRDAGYATAAFVAAFVLDRRFGLARGFGHYDDAVERHSSATVGYAERPAGPVVDAALAWMAEAPPRFFVWIHFYDPHAEYAPPAGFAAGFARRPYDGEIAYVDHQLGRLVDALVERGGSEGLLVAVTSDHGESLGEHGELTHSYTLYDATQRIPLILAGPGVPAGRVVSEPVRLVDLAPTLLGLAGAEPLAGVEGRDLRPLFSGAAAPPRVAYLETVATHLDFGWSPLFGVRAGHFKYIRAPRPELYDLAADPGEHENLAQRDPERVAELDALLTERLSRGAHRGVAASLDPGARARLRSLGYVVPEEPAEVDFESASGPDPKDEIGLLATMIRAEGLAGRGRPQEALEVLRPFEASGTALPALRAAIALGAGEPDLAARDARWVLAREPDRGDLLVILGRSFEARGDDRGARRAFERAAAVDPRLSAAWLGVARTAERLGDAPAAAAARRAASEGSRSSVEDSS